MGGRSDSASTDCCAVQSKNSQSSAQAQFLHGCKVKRLSATCACSDPKKKLCNMHIFIPTNSSWGLACMTVGRKCDWTSCTQLKPLGFTFFFITCSCFKLDFNIHFYVYEVLNNISSWKKTVQIVA